jgi:hypothetical protein
VPGPHDFPLWNYVHGAIHGRTGRVTNSAVITVTPNRIPGEYLSCQEGNAGGNLLTETFLS